MFAGVVLDPDEVRELICERNAVTNFELEGNNYRRNRQ